MNRVSGAEFCILVSDLNCLFLGYVKTLLTAEFGVVYR